MTQKVTYSSDRKNCLSFLLAICLCAVHRLRSIRLAFLITALVTGTLSSATIFAAYLPEGIKPIALYSSVNFPVKRKSESFVKITSINRVIGSAISSSDATLSNLVLGTGTLSPAFAPATQAYTASVPYNVSTITVTPTQSDINATTQVKINSQSYSNVISGGTSPSLDLNFGSNTINIRVTAQDGTTTENYSIIIARGNTPTITSAAYDAATGKLVVTGTNFEAKAGSGNDINVSNLSIEAYPTGLLREQWDGIGGQTLDQLTSNINYPDNPTSFSRLKTFEAPQNVGNDYGSRISGYISAPETGGYTFYIASDDYSELYLSTSENPLAKVLIASVSGHTAPIEWLKYSSQKSATISLVAGHTYYIEVLHKQGNGGDHVAVAWSRPSNSKITVIGGVEEGSVTAQGENVGIFDEGMIKAFDGTSDTKWLDWSTSSWIQYRFPRSLRYAVNKYAITSANDFEERDPKIWKLYGTNAVNPIFPGDYTEVDSRTNFYFTSRFEKQEFTTANNGTPYNAYRLQITTNRDNIFPQTQLSEIEFFSPEAAGNLVSTITRDEDFTTEPGLVLLKHTLTTPNVELTVNTSFTVTLDSTDRAAVNMFLNKNGSTATDGSIYNLAAAANWLSNATGAADLKYNGLTVTNVAVPKVTSATYDGASGLLQVTGTDLLTLSGLNNDILPKKLTFTGRGSAMYTLTNTPKTDIISGTSFNLILSAADKAAVNLLLNKDGTASSGGTPYNIAFAEDWAAAADPVVVVADLTGNGVTVSNASNAPVAGLGTALTLERANNEGILVPDNLSLHLGTGSFTIESWVKRGSGSGFFTVVGKQTAAGTGAFLRFDDNLLSFKAGSSASNTDVKSASPLSDNAWHHVAAVMDVAGKKMLLYIDGVLNASKPFTANSTISSAADLGIGYKPNHGEYLDGSIDEVRIWSTARSAAEIKEYFNTPLSGTEANLVAYWNFEEGGGSVVEDLSANSNTGALQNPDGDEVSAGNPLYAATLDEDTQSPLRLGGSDLDNQTSATAIVTSLPTKGKIYFTNNGTSKGAQISTTPVTLTDIGGNPRRVIYEPNANYYGTDSFNYLVFDGVRNSTNTTTVNLTVNNVIDVPTIQASGLSFTNISTSTGIDISWTNGDGSKRVVFIFEGSTGSASPLDNTTYTANTLFGSGSQIGTSGWYAVYNGTGTSVSVTGLEPGKTYRAMVVEYAILGSDIAYNGNSASSNTGNVTMPKLDQSITFAANSSKTYGDADFDPGATSDASLAVTYQSSDTNLATIVSGKVHIVATGQVTITAKQAGNGTYNAAADKTQTLTITKTQLTASLTGSVSKTFDGTTTAALTSSNYILTGVVGTEIVSLNNPASGTFDTKDQGTGKTVSVSGLVISGANASNYNLNSSAASAAIGSISKKAIAVSAEGKSKTFGDADQALTYTFTPALAGSDAFSGSLTRTTGENAGTYAINQGTLGLSTNYTIGFTPANFTINKALLIVKADELVRFQGQPNPPLTYTYSGFVNNETSAVLASQPMATTTASTASPHGVFPIVLSGASAVNYDISYINRTITVVPGQVLTSNLATLTVLENAPTGTVAGTLTSTSDDPASQFNYSLVSGSGATDNNLFSISGNQLRVAANLNFEQKANYSVRVRSTTPYNQSLEKTFTISISDVNEQPTLNDLNNQTICYASSQQTVSLSGISAGPETIQSTTIAVSSTNNALFDKLEVTQAGSSGNALLKYKLANGASGSTVITIEVRDNGGTANSGVNTILKSFTLLVNALPELTIKSDKVNVLSKGETATLKVEVTAGNSGALTYAWANAGGILSSQNTSALTVRPQETTTYHLTVTNAQGCKTEKEIIVAVNADYLVVNGTNILTPNGDGVNDRLVIRNLDMYPNNEVKIFDRAGRLLYNKKNYGNDWDGSLNGVFLTEDTYYYVVDFGPSVPKIKGFVSILKD